jgi:hypothetical protein
VKRNFWGTTWFPLVVLALLASPLDRALVGQAAAQLAKPVVVVSVASSDEVLGDVLYLTDAAGVGDFGRLAALMASPYTADLNRQNPAGMYLTMSDGAPVGVGFLPVKDLTSLLKTLEPQIGLPEDLGDGVWEIGTDRPESLFLKESDGWVFLSNSEANLANLPENPVRLLGGLNEQYTFAVRFDITALPGELRLMAAQKIREGFQERLDQELDAQDAAAIEEVGGQAMKSVLQLIEETEQVTIGWAVDKAAEKTYLDVNVTAIEGTQLASQMQAITAAASSFSGFVMPGAAMTFHSHATSTDAEVKQALAMLQQARSQLLKGIEEDDNLVNEQERQQARQIVNELLDLAADTIRAAKMDVGATLVLKPGSLTLAAGGFVSDGAKLAESLQQLAKLAEQKNPRLPSVQFNAATYRDVTLHRASLPLRTDNEQVREVLGDPMSVVLGTGEQSAYVAFGRDAEQLLKDVLDASAQDTDRQLPPAQLVMSLTPLLEFAAAAEANPAVDAALAAVRAHAGSERIVLTILPIERGAKFRLEVEEGILKAIGGVVKARNQTPQR